MSGVGSEASSRRESYFDALDKNTPKHKPSDPEQEEEIRKRNVRIQRQLSIDGFFSEQISADGGPGEGEGEQMSPGGAEAEVGGIKMDPTGSKKIANGPNHSLVRKEQKNEGNLGKGPLRPDEEAQSPGKDESMGLSTSVPHRERAVRFRGRGGARGLSEQYLAVEKRLTGIEEEGAAESLLELVDLSVRKTLATVISGEESLGENNCDTVPDSPRMVSKQTASGLSKWESELADARSPIRKLGLKPVSIPKVGLRPASNGGASDQIGSSNASPGAESGRTSSDSGDSGMQSPSGTQSPSSGLEARNRWRRVKHTLAFAHHMSQNVRSNSSDFPEHDREERLTQDDNMKGDAGRAGAAAFEGSKLRGRFRAKGRKGMEGMIVRQDKGIITLVQDFYVACLKLPMAHFLVGVFFAPIALGLLFTPIYLLGRGGLTLNGVSLAEGSILVGRIAAAKQRVSALVSVFLYALSLSTTFGGSPVTALSPFCLCIANVNTLLGQFLFVFLSGAVFARMSQPSHPLRCSKKAIIRTDEFTSLPSDVPTEKPRIFAVRLVLTGPPPCELVDAKICLTFRIFIKLPSGSMFCSTHDLDLVRPEVSYLRYGILVRHVIDQKSPVYGHTMESLLDGDASFSLTIMGLERASMQPIFHLEDYFVCDGEVAWDADYVDFISINKEGHRVLDHSKLDLIKTTKDTKMQGLCKPEKESSAQANKVPERKETAEDQSRHKGWKATGAGKAKGMNAKSSSFTRADW